MTSSFALLSRRRDLGKGKSPRCAALCNVAIDYLVHSQGPSRLLRTLNLTKTNARVGLEFDNDVNRRLVVEFRVSFRNRSVL
jgi:hypothetical protein